MQAMPLVVPSPLLGMHLTHLSSGGAHAVPFLSRDNTSGYSSPQRSMKIRPCMQAHEGQVLEQGEPLGAQEVRTREARLSPVHHAQGGHACH